MNKKLLALLNSISEKKTEIKNLVDADKLDEAKAAKEELKALQDKFDIMKDIEDDDEATNKVTATATPVADDKKVSVKNFADNVRSLRTNTMTEGVDANGGYTVPADTQTKINKYKETHRSLRDLVTVENVTSNKGSRVYETKTAVKGFKKVAEDGSIEAIGNPTFEQVTYAIADYAGYLPVSNDLLNDNDANLEDEIVNWIGRNGLATDNAQIVALAKAGTKATITGIKDIKHAVNVTIGSAYDSKIVTNDDGLDYLDNLEDKNGRPLLEANPTAPAQMQLRCGARVIPIEVIPNADLPSDTTKIPFIIGDLKEAFHIYDRQQTVLYASKDATVTDSNGKPLFNAFQQRGTLYRGEQRADYKTVDSHAFVYGELTAGE